MTTNQFVLIFVLFGISIHTIVGQLGVIRPYSNNAIDNNPVQIQEDAGTISVDAEEDDPEAEEDVMSRLGQVDTLEGFLSLMEINGRPVTPDDIYDDLVDEDGKQVISGGGRLAVPDNCSPRNTTIRIAMEGTDSEVAFFPRCTKIERCGGCCSSPHLECRPSYTERVSLKVLKGRVPFPGATHLQYTGFAPVIIDRHVSCRVVCNLDAEKCGPNKRFLRRQCRCECRTHNRCNPPKVWDHENCVCQCPRVAYRCCEPDCNTETFDDTQCDCVVNDRPSVDDGRRVISIEASSRNNNRSTGAVNVAADSPDPIIPTTPEPDTTTTSTTTTTTTSATTTVDPCQARLCPPTFIKVPRNNDCLCRPPQINGSRGRGSGSRGRGNASRGRSIGYRGRSRGRG